MSAGTQADPLTVRKTLLRILATPEFTRSPMTAKFLSYIVEETLSGRGQQLKEYSVATEGLGKPETFDPRSDATVRVQANRLRSKLKRYYTHTREMDQVLISLQPGRYAPTFRLSSSSHAAGINGAASQRYFSQGVTNQGNRYYERARHYLSAAHEGALDESIAYFVDAIAIEQNSARALAGLSYACALTALLDDRAPGDLADIGRRAAHRALELMADTPEACVALGVIACTHDYDFETAHDWMQRAAGSHADAPFWQVVFHYLRTGHWKPVPGDGRPAADSWLVNHLRRAWSASGSPLPYPECGPACAFCRTFAGLSRLATGQYLAAIDALEDGCKLAPFNTCAQGALAYAYGCSGDVRRARDILNSMILRSASAYVSKVDLAKAFLGLGNQDRSLALLREAIDECSPRVITIGVSPEFAGLRGDPRFDALLDRLSVDQRRRGSLDVSVA